MYRPELIDESREGAAVRLRFRIAPELAYFADHFPGWPILPGIVQVHWAMEFARRYFDCPRVCQRLENLKFHRIVRPSMELTLTLQFNESKSRLDFVYANSTAKYSSGAAFFGTQA